MPRVPADDCPTPSASDLRQRAHLERVDQAGAQLGKRVVDLGQMPPVGNGAQMPNVRPSGAVQCRSRLFPLLAANAFKLFGTSVSMRGTQRNAGSRMDFKGHLPT